MRAHWNTSQYAPDSLASFTSLRLLRHQAHGPRRPKTALLGAVEVVPGHSGQYIFSILTVVLVGWKGPLSSLNSNIVVKEALVLGWSRPGRPDWHNLMCLHSCCCTQQSPCSPAGGGHGGWTCSDAGLQSPGVEHGTSEEIPPNCTTLLLRLTSWRAGDQHGGRPAMGDEAALRFEAL